MSEFKLFHSGILYGSPSAMSSCLSGDGGPRFQNNNLECTLPGNNMRSP